MRAILIAILMSVFCLAAGAEVTQHRIEPAADTNVAEQFRQSLTARSSTVEICNYSDSRNSLKACNDRLSTLSLLSNENVQITGSCRRSSESIYCADLRAIVTVFKNSDN
ncbi:MAG: hypothetical protein HRT45_06035 [Bdellovibrionales bacterium]|nr:hypothetical protein [Bdellovibrionales bacterium]